MTDGFDACLLTFIYLRERGRERQRNRASEWSRGREREKENLKQAPPSGRSLMQGSIPQPWDHDLSQNQELGAQPTEPLRCSILTFILRSFLSVCERHRIYHLLAVVFYCLCLWRLSDNELNLPLEARH